MTTTKDVLAEIEQERERQDLKWGPDRDQSVADWMLILGEEYGEACKDAVDYTFSRDRERVKHLLNMRAELIQTAAVAAAAVQSIDNYLAPRCRVAHDYRDFQ